MSRAAGRIKTFFKNKRDAASLPGMALIEVVFASLIMGMILLSVFFLNASSYKHFMNQSNKADSLFGSSHPLIWVSKDIKQANRISSSAVFNGSVFSTGLHCLVLEIPSVDANGHIIDIENTHDIIIYWKHDQFPNQLMRTVVANPASARSSRSRILNSSLHSINFIYYDASGNSTSSYTETALVEITLSAKFSGIGKNYLESFSTSVKLRNKPAL